MKRVIKHAKRLKELRVINNLLTVVVVGLGIYIILAPLLPQLGWWAGKAPVISALTTSEQEIKKEADSTIGSNRLFIPSIGLEEVVFTNTSQLSKGVVHRGFTSTPDKGSNTVLVGHRFMYDEKGVFYHLDKVKVGDTITVHWDKHRYDYVVTESFVVPPEQVSIEEPTDEDILTLYTCTPLWTAKNRLVIQAELQEQL